MRHKYTEKEFINAVQSSISVREALQKLQIKPCGGNYYTFYNFAKRLNINLDHFKGQGHNKDKKFGHKRPLKDYLNNKFPIQSHKLRLRLLEENIFPHLCSNCNNGIWLNQPIPLELDHINGNHLDNTLSNLRLLCPNCHSLTSNYRGKNKKSK